MSTASRPWSKFNRHGWSKFGRRQHLCHEATKALATLTMSSREIAELTGKELSHVHRDIRAMLDDLQKDDPFVDDVREDKDARGYTTSFHLNREMTYTLLTGYSVPLRRKVVARWQELEAQQAPKLPTTMAEALRLAANQVRMLRLPIWRSFRRAYSRHGNQRRLRTQANLRAADTPQYSCERCLESRLTDLPNGEALFLQGKSSLRARKQ